jgi:hypothetical protein
MGCFVEPYAERQAGWEGMASGVLPGPVVGHRPFDGKEPLIVVSDDEEERRELLGHVTSMGPKYGTRRAGSAHISFNARSKMFKSSRS